MNLLKIYCGLNCPGITLSNNIEQGYFFISTVITAPQRHISWRRAVPSLRLWPQELSFLVQVCLYFCLRTWTHKLTLPLQHFIFNSNLRDSLDTFLEQNPDLTEEEVANPERMVGIEYILNAIYHWSLVYIWFHHEIWNHLNRRRKSVHSTTSCLLGWAMTVMWKQRVELK